jgi:hypothetical protein
MMDIDERFYRIDAAPYIVFPDDKTIHVVENIEIVGDTILIETDTGWLFNDMDVFTVEEMVHAEQQIEELINSI